MVFFARALAAAYVPDLKVAFQHAGDLFAQRGIDRREPCGHVGVHRAFAHPEYRLDVFSISTSKQDIRAPARYDRPAPHFDERTLIRPYLLRFYRHMNI